MLDASTNQATGLMALGAPQGPRLMAMVNHGDDAFELALLWRLCSAMVRFGYAVTVLDATTCETQTNPGLEQLLEYEFWQAHDDPQAPEWSVIPSAYGLQSLSTMQERRAQSLQHLGQLFAHEGIVIFYGHAQWLAPFLNGSGVKPLLAVTPMKSSLLSSYVALKHLLLNGRLEPTIANLEPGLLVKENPRVRGAATTLSECAKNFLGFEVNALNIAAPCEDDRPCSDIEHLALRMLEDSVALKPALAMGAPHTTLQGGLGHFTGSH